MKVSLQISVCGVLRVAADWMIRFGLTSLAPFQVAQHNIKMHTCSVDSFSDCSGTDQALCSFTHLLCNTV